MPEVFEHEDEVVVTLDVPPEGEEGISVSVEGDTLVVSATGGERPYQHEVLLPCAVDASAACCGSPCPRGAGRQRHGRALARFPSRSTIAA